MSAELSFVTLDVFTSTRYRGNPLAIVHVPQSTSLSQDQKQRVAREFNLSETVFLHEQTQSDISDGSVRIDIFTALAEVPFAGHPTVGTANYLLRLLQNSPFNNVKALQAKAGRLPVTLDTAVDGLQISVAHNVRIHSAPFADQPYGRFPVVSIVKGMTFILGELENLDSLAAQKQNLVGTNATYTAAEKLDEGWREGIVCSYFYVDLGLTSQTGVRNLRVRMLGSREDPATGSAASALTSYLSLKTGQAGRYRYALTQGVEMGQQSNIFVEVAVKAASGGGVEIDEVLLSGCAVQTMQGTLRVPTDE